MRRIAPLGLALVSVFVLALPAWALNDQRFTQPRIYDATAGTSDVVTADFNGDGVLDLATANRGENDIVDDSPAPNDGDISVTFGKEGGTFGPTQEIDSFGSNPERNLANTATDIIAADLDGDEDIDLAFTDQGDGLGENNGGGDGFLVTMLNDGSGVFERRDAERLLGGSNPVELVAADFDGEGDLEIAVANAGAANTFGEPGPAGTNGTVSILRNSGGGNFTVVQDDLGAPAETLDPASNDSVQSIATGDYNGDGDPDLALALDDNAPGDADEVYVYLGGAGRSFTTLADPTHTVGDAPRHIVSADFDRDNNVDFATANNSSDDVSVALGNGDGTFDPPTAYPAAEGPYAITTADFNIDGKLDLAVANSYNDDTSQPNGDEGTVSVLPGKGPNNGDGTFEAGRQNNTADGPVGIVSGFFNGDDLPDLATANYGTDGPDREDGSMAVLLGRYQCDDGANNDNEGGIDFPNDPGCESTTDNTESPNPASYSIDDVSEDEGNTGTTDFTFTVTRTGEGVSQATSVQYATEDGTATQPSDYQEKTGTVNFAAGDTTEEITITVNGDINLETNETFRVVLSNPSSGSVIPTPEAGEGLGTIQNDDQPQCNNGVDDDGDGKIDFGSGSGNDPGCASATDDTESPDLPEISIGDVTLTEGDSGTRNANFTVTRSGNTAIGSEVDFATQDDTATQPSDYTQKSGTLTFAANETSKQVTVVVNGDTTLEDDETFKVNLSNAVDARIGDGEGVGTIQNDEPTQCNDGVDNDGDGRIDFGSGSGNDPGCSSGGDDSENPDQPLVTIDNTSVTEGDSGTTNATFTVTRTGDTTGPSTVDYATEDGSARAPQDYAETTGTVAFAPGDTSETVTVPVKGDTVDENNENFRVNLSNPNNAFIEDSQGVGTITDDDDSLANLNLDITDSRDPVPSGETLTYELEVTNNGPDTAKNVEARFSIPRGTEFTTLPTDCEETSQRVVTCELGNIANGDSRSPEVGVKVNRSTRFNVNGEVSSDAIDGTPDNNSERERTRVR